MLIEVQVNKHNEILHSVSPIVTVVNCKAKFGHEEVSCIYNMYKHASQPAPRPTHNVDPKKDQVQLLQQDQCDTPCNAEN